MRDQTRIVLGAEQVVSGEWVRGKLDSALIGLGPLGTPDPDTWGLEPQHVADATRLNWMGE